MKVQIARWTVVALPILIMIVILETLYADSTKLNPPLIDAVVNYAFFTADSQHVLYQLDRATDEIAMFSVPTGGGASNQLTPFVANSGGVRPLYQCGTNLSSDSNYFVYCSDQDTDEVRELYSVPVTGSMADIVKLNQNLVSGGDISSDSLMDVQISPAGGRVVYIADQDTDDKRELYSVPITGPASAGVKLNLALNGQVRSFKFTPDGQHVIYRVYDSDADTSTLYKVPATGPASNSIKLDGTHDLHGDIFSFEISHDGQTVIYDASVPGSGSRLFKVPIGGGTPVELTDDFSYGGVYPDYKFSPDDQYIIYRAEKGICCGDDPPELYSVPLNGSPQDTVTLNNDLGENGEVRDFTISPDSSRVVYETLHVYPVVDTLYSVPISGPASSNIQLAGTDESPPINSYQISIVRITPNSQRVVYGEYPETSPMKIHSVPIDGPEEESIILHLPSLSDDSVQTWWLSPDGLTVAYILDQDTPGVREVYRVPVAGPASEAAKLNDTITPGGEILWPIFSPNSSFVIYIGDQDTNDVYELYITSDGQVDLPYKQYLPLVTKGN